VDIGGIIMKYKIGMKVKTLDYCEIRQGLRGKVYTIKEVEHCCIGALNSEGMLFVFGNEVIDEKATKKLNLTKADFNKKLKFDEIEIELQFNQAYENDTDIFINIVDFNNEIFTTISPKQAKKLIKHLQKMVDYVEE
jgi:hypothetical protein